MVWPSLQSGLDSTGLVLSSARGADEQQAMKSGCLAAGLLGCNGADERELVPLPVVCLVHAEEPDEEPDQPDQPAKRQENEPHEVKDGSHDPERDAQGNGQSNPGGANRMDWNAWKRTNGRLL